VESADILTTFPQLQRAVTITRGPPRGQGRVTHAGSGFCRRGAVVGRADALWERSAPRSGVVCSSSVVGSKPWGNLVSHHENRRKSNHVFLGIYCAMGVKENLGFGGLRFCGGVESVDVFSSFPRSVAPSAHSPTPPSRPGTRDTCWQWIMPAGGGRARCGSELGPNSCCLHITHCWP
jgi:hypothetical protein